MHITEYSVHSLCEHTTVVAVFVILMFLNFVNMYNPSVQRRSNQYHSDAIERY